MMQEVTNVSTKKAEVIKAFLPVLQLTRAGSDVIDLCYIKDKFGFENVYVTYADGRESVVEVTADSGATMLKDVLDALT